MENLTLFIIGFCIFGSYMFFLLRMIFRQHNIQKKSDTASVNVKQPVNEDLSSSN